MRGFLAMLLPLCLLEVSVDGADGRVRMCPPGGSSFTMAWSMACSMRKKRSIDEQSSSAIDRIAKRAFIAPSVRQLQRICCNVGCTVSDLLGYCGPLGW